MPERLDGRLAEFKRQLDRLPEAETPLPTTLQVLGRGQLEQDWQRLLFHFLSPERPHGLDHAFLEHLLTTLADHDEVEYTCLRLISQILVSIQRYRRRTSGDLRMGCDLRCDMGANGLLAIDPFTHEITASPAVIIGPVLGTGLVVKDVPDL